MTRPRVGELLEKMSRIIPGIAGYQDREHRRDADRAVREEAAAGIARCREKLMGVMSDLSRSGGMKNLRAVGGLERLVTRLERLEDEIRYAPSGYAGWFDHVGITLEDLEKIYEADLRLLEGTIALSDLVGGPETIGTEGDWTAGVEEAVSGVTAIFEGRKRNMKGPGADR